MPIISFNVSESLRNFIKKMVYTKEYKNNSNVIRDALIRLMKAKGELDTAELETFVQNPTALDEFFPKLTGAVMINIDAFSEKVEKKLAKIETEYYDGIIHKNTFVYDGLKTITYILKDTMNRIQEFITELNAIEELKSFRYVINEPEEEV